MIKIQNPDMMRAAGRYFGLRGVVEEVSYDLDLQVFHFIVANPRSGDFAYPRRTGSLEEFVDWFLEKEK